MTELNENVGFSDSPFGLKESTPTFRAILLAVFILSLGVAVFYFFVVEKEPSNPAPVNTTSTTLSAWLPTSTELMVRRGIGFWFSVSSTQMQKFSKSCPNWADECSDVVFELDGKEYLFEWSDFEARLMKP